MADRHMQTNEKIIWYVDRFEVLRHAAAIAPLTGLILEFGVASGATIRCLAASAPLQHRKIFGFDSFEGLPEPWSSYPAGHFACHIPAVPSNVELVVGLFAETLPAFLAAHPEDVALLHIDCDLYASTRTILEQLSQRIVPGTVIGMDEFYIVTDHEQRAFRDWLATTNRRCRFEARSREQLCVMMET